ncbi:MAG: hypothetical protein ACOYNC_00915 [Bacteroidales bacterium]
MKNYLFDLPGYLKELKLSPEKEELVKNYESLVQPFKKIRKFRDFPFYDPYLAKFLVVPYLVPEDCSDMFDWELLFRLMGCSLANEIDFEWIHSKGLPEMLIHVASSDKEGKAVEITNKVSELMSFQVLRLFEIYTEEMMVYEMLLREAESEEMLLTIEKIAQLKKNSDLVSRINKARMINNLRTLNNEH